MCDALCSGQKNGQFLEGVALNQSPVTAIEKDGIVWIDGVPFTPKMVEAFSKKSEARPRTVMTKEDILAMRVNVPDSLMDDKPEV